MKGKYLGRLSKLQSKFGLKDSDTLALYHQKWWEQFILQKLKKIPQKSLKGLVKRWAFFDKSYKIPQIKQDLKEYDIFLNWVLDFDKNNHAKQVKQNTKNSYDIFKAISIATPGGLGFSKKYDVNEIPKTKLYKAMEFSKKKDLIARQYCNGFKDIFDTGIPAYKNFYNKWEQVIQKILI